LVVCEGVPGIVGEGGRIREHAVMTAETAFESLSFFDEVVAVLPVPPPDGRLIGESLAWLE
jgi:hypothetical protein